MIFEFSFDFNDPLFRSVAFVFVVFVAVKIVIGFISVKKYMMFLVDTKQPFPCQGSRCIRRSSTRVGRPTPYIEECITWMAGGSVGSVDGGLPDRLAGFSIGLGLRTWYDFCFSYCALLNKRL